MAIYLKYLVFSFYLTLMALPVFSQAPLNWTRDEINPGEDFTLSPDEAKFTEGEKSCRMQLHTGAVPYLVSDVFYIIPGAEYTFSMDVFDNDTSGQVKIYADFYDTYGFDVFGQEPVFSVDSSGWQTIAWEGAVPEQAVVGYVMIKFYCQPDLYTFNKTADIWIDNVQFKINGDTNRVLNGGFENWFMGLDGPTLMTEGIVIKPNPARHYVHIKLPEGTNEIFMTDLSGKTIYHQSAYETHELQMDVHNFNRGLYLIRASRSDGLTLTEKLILR